MIVPFAALALAAVPAPSALPDDAIVVTGRRRDEAAVRTQAARFVRSIAPVAIDGQYARWNVPLCVKVVGLSPTHAAIVANRIVGIARAAKAPVAATGCRANVAISFTDDARQLVAAIERKDGRALSELSAIDRRAVRDGDAPVRWWHRTLTEGADGRPMQSTPGPGLDALPMPSNGRPRFLDTYTSSLIDTRIRVGIADVVVLVDVPRANGRRLDAVAAYAAFVILARTADRSRGGGPPTILDLFTDPNGPDMRDLTDWDRAYLAALYRVAPNRPANVQRRMMETAMVAAMR